MGVAGIDCLIVVDRQVLYGEALCNIARNASLADEGRHFTELADALAFAKGRRVLVVAEEALFQGDAAVVARSIRNAFSTTRLVCSSDNMTRSRAMALVGAGVNGIIVKTLSSQESLDALFTVVRGGVYFPAAEESADAGGPVPSFRGPGTPCSVTQPIGLAGQGGLVNVNTIDGCAGQSDARIMVLNARRTISVPPEVQQAGISASPNTSEVRHLASSAPRLSERQKDVYALMARGLSNKRIAQELDLSEATVKVHVQNLFRALRVQSRYQAISHYHVAFVQSRAV